MIFIKDSHMRCFGIETGNLKSNYLRELWFDFMLIFRFWTLQIISISLYDSWEIIYQNNFGFYSFYWDWGWSFLGIFCYLVNYLLWLSFWDDFQYWTISTHIAKPHFVRISHKVRFLLKVFTYYVNFFIKIEEKFIFISSKNKFLHFIK